MHGPDGGLRRSRSGRPGHAGRRPHGRSAGPHSPAVPAAGPLSSAARTRKVGRAAVPHGCRRRHERSGGMHARSTTIRGNPGSLDEAITYMRDDVLPAMQDMDGFVGLSMLCERDTGRCVMTSAWTDEQAMRASADKIHPMRERLVEEFGGEPEVQEWEIAVMHRDHQSGDGACARIVWTRVPADRIDQLEERWRSLVMPQLTEMAGFCSCSYMV